MANAIRHAATLAVVLIVQVLAPVDAAEKQILTAGSALEAMLGGWKGRATTTPRGPRPYDMTFVRQPDGAVAAVAHPGSSAHHWTIRINGTKLDLTFLSTFGGNQTPQRFKPGVIKSDRVIFRTARKDRLTVTLTPKPRTLAIDIMRFDKLHVAIRLKREPRN
jgi:hypothetical protein